MQRILVGPDSAGAEPGPACYGRGGEQATVTDADLAIGKIDPDCFAGGKIAVDPARAAAALTRAVGDRPGGKTATTAPNGITETADRKRAKPARSDATRRGR